MRVHLPWPSKVLWPNGPNGNRYAKSGSRKSHRKWACAAAMAAGERFTEGPIAIKLTVFPKARGPLPDQDNCIAACKAYLDGIADAIGVNDKHFTAPVVEYAHRTKHGDFLIELVAIRADEC